MSVSRAKLTDLPKDAVVLTEEEAFSFQWKLVTKWDKLKDVWALRYGPGILGTISAVSGIYINNYYRYRMKLGGFGRISTYLPIVVLPAFLSAVYHKGFVQHNIVLKPHLCSSCYEVRAVSLQTVFGLIYPAILSPIASFMYATRHFTYNVPPLSKPKDVFKLWIKLTKPLKSFLVGSLIFNTVIAAFVTQMEIDNMYTIRYKMMEFERQITNNLVVNGNK